MTLLVVGTTAFDSIETPHGKQERCLGGSATYFSLASRLFDETRLVSVVGTDFPDESRQMFEDRGICLDGLTVADGATFFWSGKYSADMNSRETIDVQLNTFGDFEPKISQGLQTTPFVFLANSAPAQQISVLEQMHNPIFTVADTMDLWIETQRDTLGDLMTRIDGLIANDEEVKMLTGESNLIRAGRRLLEAGPKFVIIKKGEHGAFLLSHDFQYALPAYPTDAVVDPTGAGDSFAGGFMGFLGQSGDLSPESMKRALAYGTVTASLTVEDFGVSRLAEASCEDVERRYAELIQFVSV